MAYRTTRYEPSLYCAGCDETDSLALYSHWADEAWLKATGGCADPVVLPDYELGFHAGFVDYCYAGGTGEPPPMPPRVYWNIEGRVADGKAAARAWFDGYRHGARVARDGGYRESAIVQSSTAVHHPREESYRDQMAQNGEFGRPFVFQTSEPLPTPTNAPQNDALRTVQPEVIPQVTLPELTSPSSAQPATGKPGDGASTKSRDPRVRAASFTASGELRKPFAGDKSGSAKERIGRSSKQNNQVQRDPNTKLTVTREGRRSCEAVPPNGHANPDVGRDNDFQVSAVNEPVSVPRTDSTTSTQRNGDGGNLSKPSLPTEKNHTTLVFKATSN